MESMISKLIESFENGNISRRQLIRNLAITASAATVAAVPAAGADSVLKAVGVSHISYQVKDYAKTRDFYVDLLGMRVAKDDGKSKCNLYMGNTFLGPRTTAGPSMVDHVSYFVDNWNKRAIEEELKKRGYKPEDESGPDGEGLQLKDPDGMHVQIQPKP